MESDLSRREFLERTAVGAGIAASAALPASTILAEAAKASFASNPLPSPRNVPIDHFVILMMTNRPDKLDVDRIEMLTRFGEKLAQKIVHNETQLTQQQRLTGGSVAWIGL